MKPNTTGFVLTILICSLLSGPTTTELSRPITFESPTPAHFSDDLVAQIHAELSSSGESKNLINAIKAAKNQKTLTITSFNKDNTLGQLGHHNLFLETKFYGYAEIASLALMHFFLDRLVGENQ